MYCFILYISLALLIRPGSGMTLPLDSESDEIQDPVAIDMKSMKSLKNAAEIMQLLKLLNKGSIKNKSLQRQNSDTGIDFDYLGVSNERGDMINELAKIIKKNISHKEKQVIRPSDRLVYISNPEVLDEYRKQQNKQRLESLDSDEEERDDDSIAAKHLLDVLQHLRRFDEQNNEEKEPELDRPDKSIGTFTLVKSEVDDKGLRKGRENQYDSGDEKSKPYPSKKGVVESKHDIGFDSRQDDFDMKSKKKNDAMNSSGEKPKRNSNKKKENDRFKNDDRYSDEFSSKKNRNQDKKPKSNPMLSKIQMQDNPSYGGLGSLSKSRSKPISKAKVRGRERERGRDRGRERERERPRDTGSAFHSYGRTPVPLVGKRGIYEEAE